MNQNFAINDMHVGTLILNNKPEYFQNSLKTWFDEAVAVYGLFSAGL